MPGFRLTDAMGDFIVEKSKEEEVKARIKEQFKAKFGRPLYTTTLNDVLDKFDETNDTADRPRPGRPPLYDQRDQRLMVRQAVATQSDGVRKLADDEDFNPKGASKSTINNILRAHKIASIVKPLRLKDLTVRNVKARYKFAKKHIDWTEDDWKKVVFSDESDLFPAYCGREYVRLRPNQNIIDVVPLSTESKKNVTVKVWGVLTSEGVGPLVKYTGTLNGPRYKAMLDTHLLQNLPMLENLDIIEDGSQEPP